MLNIVHVAGKVAEVDPSQDSRLVNLKVQRCKWCHALLCVGEGPMYNEDAVLTESGGELVDGIECPAKFCDQVGVDS